MTARLSPLLQRYPLLAGFILMFAFTWPLDLGLAAQSRELLPFHIPEPLGIFVGYGFVVATLIIVGVTEGKGGIRALLRRFLIWRVGPGWYGVVLFGFAAINLLAIGLHVLLGGRVPDFNAPFARQLAGPSMNLWLLAAIFFLFDVFTNGEEIGWRGYALPRLQARHSALIASVIIGITWAVWHVPKYLGAGVALNAPFALVVLDKIALAILFTWLYNNTKGSLLLATLFHAASNAADVCLPIMPVAIGDVRPQLLAIGLHCAAAIFVVAVAGPARLTRKPTPTIVSVPAAI